MTSVPTTELWRVIDRELTARDMGRGDLWKMCAARHGGQPNSYARRAWRWDHQDDGAAPLERADELLTVLGLHIDDLAVEFPEPATERRRGGGKPAGVYGYLTDAHLRALHVAYMRGASLRALAGQIWTRTRYASAKSCAMGIQQGFVRLGLERRDRIAATRAASTTHGLAPRGNVDPAHRRRLRVQRGDVLDRPMCAGHKTTYPGRGRPCRARATAGSAYCAQHDPARADARTEHMAAMRAKAA